MWQLRITPAAGAVKGGKARDVPLNPHLAEQGLIEFVLGCAEGPLFYDAERPRGGSAFNPPYQKVGARLARWVREIGVDDPHVDPNHGWRHLFKTVARRVRMRDEVRDGIAGHAPRTVGEAYGAMPLEAIQGLALNWERRGDVCIGISDSQNTRISREPVKAYYGKTATKLINNDVDLVFVVAGRDIIFLYNPCILIPD